jgi:hypothetical protein
VQLDLPLMYPKTAAGFLQAASLSFVGEQRYEPQTNKAIC